MLDRVAIPSGQDYAQVHNAAITPDSRVFVTMKKNPGSQWWVDEVGEGFLVVKTAQPVIEDIPFDYRLVSTVDERTPSAPSADRRTGRDDYDDDGFRTGRRPRARRDRHGPRAGHDGRSRGRDDSAGSGSGAMK